MMQDTLNSLFSQLEPAPWLCYVFPVLALGILVRCAVSLLTFRQEPEVWAWLTTPDGTHIPVTHWESLVGRGAGCENRAAVTPDTRKGYLISEFGGQQLPTKPFDDETHRLVQALRYAAGINDSIAQQGVAGSFGWCMTDYNTHREFGSGDRICYHGMLDMFRNPKLAAAVYASQKTPRSPSDIVLEVSSGMALGDLPGGIPVATTAVGNSGATNAGLLAVQMLSAFEPELADKLEDYRNELKEKVAESNAQLV